MAAVSVQGLSKAFNGQQVLRGVDLDVASGSLVAILGASGSGKTTLLRLLCGFERADAGTIRIGEAVMAEKGRHLLPEKRKIGYVAQEGALFPHLSVAENIVFGLKRRDRRVTGEEAQDEPARRRVARLLDMVGLPASFAARPPHELSGGEQQRVALARALAPSPRLVLLDEPFSALDAALRAETRQAVAAALTAAGATALLVTHDQSEALAMGHRVAVMRQGRLVQIASPDILYRRPADPDLARFVGEAVLLPGRAARGRVTCALGLLVLATETVARDGEVDVLIRPEQIRVAPQTGQIASLQLSGPQISGMDIRARVREVIYYGHDASLRLELVNIDRAISITARVPGHMTPAPGAEVVVTVEGDVVAYPCG